jgi:hypothetical protein
LADFDFHHKPVLIQHKSKLVCEQCRNIDESERLHYIMHCSAEEVYFESFGERNKMKCADGTIFIFLIPFDTRYYQNTGFDPYPKNSITKAKPVLNSFQHLTGWEDGVPH